MKRLLAGIALVIIGIAGCVLAIQGTRAAQESGTANPLALGVLIGAVVLCFLGLALVFWGLAARGGQRQAQAWAAVRARFPFLQPTKQTVRTVMGKMSYDYGLTPGTEDGLDHRPLEPLGTSSGYRTRIFLEGVHDGMQVQIGDKTCGYGQSAISTVWVRIKLNKGLPYKVGVWTGKSQYDTGRVPVPPQLSAATVRATDVLAAAALFHDGHLLRQLCAVARSGGRAPTTLFWQHEEGLFECNRAGKSPVYERAMAFAIAFATRVAAQSDRAHHGAG